MRCSMQDWDKGPEAITAKPKGRGPFGTLNQAGNVWEWVTDCYDGGAYEKRKAQSEKTTPALPVVNPVDDRSGCGLARIARRFVCRRAQEPALCGPDLGRAHGPGPGSGGFGVCEVRSASLESQPKPTREALHTL
jgi:hypothetical protein